MMSSKVNRSLFTSPCVLTQWKESKLTLCIVLLRALIPFMRVPPSWPNYLPEATPWNTITWEAGFQYLNLGSRGHKHFFHNDRQWKLHKSFQACLIKISHVWFSMIFLCAPSWNYYTGQPSKLPVGNGRAPISRSPSMTVWNTHHLLTIDTSVDFMWERNRFLQL